MGIQWLELKVLRPEGFGVEGVCCGSEASSSRSPADRALRFPGRSLELEDDRQTPDTRERERERERERGREGGREGGRERERRRRRRRRRDKCTGTSQP